MSFSKLLDVLQRLVAEVSVVELGVVAALGHQLVVGTLLDDLAVIHHQDAVGVLDGRERWAITMAVRSSMIASSPSWICISVKGSTLAVARPG
jgi:hypothetical protein